MGNVQSAPTGYEKFPARRWLLIQNDHPQIAAGNHFGSPHPGRACPHDGYD
jgi:hypothetical protein